jgi:hypothetical protein
MWPSLVLMMYCVLEQAATIHQLHDAVAAPGQVVIVRDHQNRRALLRVDLAQQREHALGRLRVEVAGGLVGQDQRRIQSQRADDRHALLLPAGRVRRAAVLPPGEAYLVEQPARTLRDRLVGVPARRATAMSTDTVTSCRR